MGSPWFKMKIKIISECQYVYWKALRGASSVQSRWLSARQSAWRDTASFSSTMCRLYAPLRVPLYFCILLCSSSNGPKDLKTSSLDCNQTHFSWESKMWSNSKPISPFQSLFKEAISLSGATYFCLKEGWACGWVPFQVHFENLIVAVKPSMLFFSALGECNIFFPAV